MTRKATGNVYRRLLLPLSLLLLGVATPLAASINDNLGVSNKASSLGHAVTADPPGIMSIHFNPAGLARLKGGHAELNLVTPRFDWGAEFIAPDDFEGIFGYTDDPVIGGRSRTRNWAMHAPMVGWVKMPEYSVLPLPAFSYSPEDSRLTFATAVYAPTALGFYRERDDDPARFGGRRMALQRITYFSPSVGFQATRSLSLGASIGFNYSAFALRTDFRAPNPLIGFIGFFQDEVCPAMTDLTGLLPECLGSGLGPYEHLASLELMLEDPLSLSYNLGLLWEPRDWFAFGAVYQSRMEANLSGDFTIHNSEALQSTFGALGASPLFGPIAHALGIPIGADAEDHGRARLTVVFPARVQLGMKLRPLSRLQLNADWNWSDWSEWDELGVSVDRQTPLLQFAGFLGFGNGTELILPRGYQSRAHWSFGVLLDLTERLQLRLGYEPRKSSIPDSAHDTIAPLGDADLYGVGLGYAVSNRFSVDLAAAYLSAESYIPAGTSCNLNCEGMNNLVYNPYAGLDVKTSLEVLILGLSATYRF